MVSKIQDADLEHIWQQVRCFQELSDARLFITGGTGFFGCWLLESLCFAKRVLGLSTEVVVLTRNKEAFIKKRPHLAQMPGLTLWQGDVSQFPFPPGEFTHIIHAATDASMVMNRDHPLAMLDTIVKGTRHTLNFAVTAQVKKFLLVSSGAVYGTQPPHLSHIDESYSGAPDPLNPASAYGLGKRLAEHLGIVFAKEHSINVTIARCFAFIGPYLPQDIHFALGNFILDARCQRAIQIHGDGSPYRSYLYAADLVIWLWTILCEGQSGVAYNVGSEEAINLFDLAHLVAKCQGNIAVHVAKARDPNVLASRYVPKTALAQNKLNLKQHIPLKDAIERTLAWSLLS